MMARLLARFRPIVRSLHAWQAFLVLMGFALPFTLFPLAQPRGSTLLWERVPSYPGGSMVRRVIAGQSAQLYVLYVVDATGSIHLSVDDGAQWSLINSDLPHGPLSQVRILDIVVDPSDASLAYAVVDSPSESPRPSVYWTADMGLSWKPRASLRQERVQAIALDPFSGDPYVITAHEVLRGFVYEEASREMTRRERFTQGSDDLHWLSIGSFESRVQATGLTISAQTVVSLPAAMSPHGRGRPIRLPSLARSPDAQRSPASDEALILYIGTQGKGLNILVDSPLMGPYLVAAQEDEDTRYVRQMATIHALCVDPHQPGRVYVGTDQGIYVSRDAGVSWHKTAYPLRARRIYALLADPLTVDTLYAGLAGGGVHVSEDAGATWQPLGQGLGRATVFSLALYGKEQGVLYAGTDNGLWRLTLRQRALSR